MIKNTPHEFQIHWTSPSRQQISVPANVDTNELTYRWDQLRKALSDRYPSFEPLNVFSDYMAKRLTAWSPDDAAMRTTLISQINQLEDIVQALELDRR